MATIRTSIQVQDNMSRALTHMNSAMQTVISSFENMQRTSGNAVNTAAIQSARQELARAEGAFNGIEQEIRQANQQQQQFNNSVRQGTNATSGLLSKLGSIVATYVTFQAGKSVVGLSDELTNITARLNMVNDGMQTTAELQQMIYDSAQRSYGSYADTADLVGKLAMNAGDAFGSNSEVVQFGELLNKQFSIAGTNAEGVKNATLQLTQALGGGVLRGQELNSIFEHAPNIIHTIADYLDVPIGKIREMAADGAISADVVKKAMFASADEINEKFETMPLTFSQLWTSFKNEALWAFQPVLGKINEIANSEKFQNMMGGIVNSFHTLSNVALATLSVLMTIGGFMYDNWSVIEPVIWGAVTAMGAYATITGIQAAATWLSVAANRALIATMLANPIMWVAIAIGVLIAVIYKWVESVGGLEIAWKIAMNGILTAWDWVKIGFFTGVNWVIDLMAKMQLGFLTAGVAISNYMGDMKVSVLNILQSMVNGAIGIINDFIGLLNKIPGVSIEAIAGVTFAGTAQAENDASKQARMAELQDFRSDFEANMLERNASIERMKSEARLATANRQSEIAMLKISASNEDKFDPAKAMKEALASQNDIMGAIEDVGGSGKDTAGNTKKIADSVNMAVEDLQYLRDLSEREAINRYTTGEIKIDMKNENYINNEMDIDGVIDGFVEKLEEAVEVVAEGDSIY